MDLPPSGAEQNIFSPRVGLILLKSLKTSRVDMLVTYNLSQLYYDVWDAGMLFRKSF